MKPSRPVLRPGAARRRLSRGLAVVAPLGLVTALAAGAPGLPGTPAALASGGTPTLEAGPGQYFPVTPVKVLDTRDGTGGVPAAPLAAGATVIVPVDGMGQVPPAGVTDVYAVISAFNPTASGAIEDYNTDVSNPGIWTLPFTGGGPDVTVSDMIQVSGSGDISVTNASSGTADVSVTVLGYVADQTSRIPGDLYTALPEAAVLDTRSGLGAPRAQVPAGGSVTVQIAGVAGVPSGAAGAAVFLGAANASQAGWVSAYPAGGTDPNLRVLSYAPGRVVHNLYYGPLSSSGRLTLVNHGTAPVDLMALVQGYLSGPAALAGGSTYTSVPERRIADTRDGTGGVPATPVPAGGSVTFSATGADGVPASGVSAVVQTVAALNPTGNGYLSVYPAGGADPDEPGVNFNAGDIQDNDLTAAMVTPVSNAGDVTVTNHSSGTVDVVVAIRGYYTAPTAPNPPDSVLDTPVSQTSETVSWQPPFGDGNAPITGYTITAPPDAQSVTVGPGTTSVTLTGLTNASADDFTVTATNAYGSSAGADDEYALPPTAPAAGTPGAGWHAIAQELGFSVDPATGQASVADSYALSLATDASGNIVTTPVTPDTADALSQASTQSYGCSKHIRNTTGGPSGPVEFNNEYDSGWGFFHWVNWLYTLTGANYNAATKLWAFEAMMCASGDGQTQNRNYHATLLEDAVEVNDTGSGTLANAHWGALDTSTSTVASNLNFQLGGQYQGAVIGVSSGESVVSTVTTAEIGGLSGGTDAHWGYLFPNPPGEDLLKYWPTRLNVWWKSDTPAGRQTVEPVGNGGEALWEWWNANGTDNGKHVYYTFSILVSCVTSGSQTLCGKGVANGS